MLSSPEIRSEPLNVHKGAQSHILKCLTVYIIIRVAHAVNCVPVERSRAVPKPCITRTGPSAYKQYECAQRCQFLQ